MPGQVSWLLQSCSFSRFLSSFPRFLKKELERLSRILAAAHMPIPKVLQ